MTGNGNGTKNGNGNGTHRWWQVWKRGRSLDLSAYRRLALQLHLGLNRGDNAARSALVVTANESRLGATGSLTLASCMAEELQRPALLIDATADGEVGKILHSPETQGLTDFLKDPMRPVQELVLPTSQQNVWFLSRGTAKGSSFPASPENARDLLVRAAKQWDFVVVAGGPVLQNSLPLAMAPHVGRVLLLVMENRTYKEDIARAQSALELCKAQNVSLVMTQLGKVVR